MKPLRPLTVLTLGTPLLGIAVAVGTWIALPSSRDFSSFAWALAVGATLGSTMFGPIAAILAIGGRHPEWLDRYSWRIGFYSSLAMALSMGYLAACLRHSVSDNLMLAAFAIVFLAATVKAALSYALRQQRKPNGR